MRLGMELSLLLRGIAISIFIRRKNNKKWVRQYNQKKMKVKKGKGFIPGVAWS